MAEIANLCFRVYGNKLHRPMDVVRAKNDADLHSFF